MQVKADTQEREIYVSVMKALMECVRDETVKSNEKEIQDKMCLIKAVLSSNTAL